MIAPMPNDAAPPSGMAASRPNSAPPREPLAGVLCRVPADLERARALAGELGVALLETESPGLRLEFAAAGLQLVDASPGAPGALRVDLAEHARRATGASWRRDPLARAVGLRRHGRPDVFDATLGLGRDAFLLASLGCRVRAAERSPVVRALVEDALRRARSEGRSLDVLDRLEILPGDAFALLEQIEHSPERPEVVLLDPMFPERRKSARVRKEMQLVQRLLGADTDADLLLQQALRAARRRVLVKRPHGAVALDGGRPPSLTVDGRSLRFDVYLLDAPPN